MSAFGGKADMIRTGANVRFWPKEDTTPVIVTHYSLGNDPHIR